jgi:hypothetical protein
MNSRFIVACRAGQGLHCCCRRIAQPHRSRPYTSGVQEVATGYRADALKGETIGKISDFVFGKDNNIYVVLGVGDLTWLTGQLIAIPFHALKLDNPSDNIVLSRAALEKLPVFVSNR